MLLESVGKVLAERILDLEARNKQQIANGEVTMKKIIDVAGSRLMIS